MLEIRDIFDSVYQKEKRWLLPRKGVEYFVCTHSITCVKIEDKSTLLKTLSD